MFSRWMCKRIFSAEPIPTPWVIREAGPITCCGIMPATYQTGESVDKAFGLQGPVHGELGIAMDMSIGMKVPSGAICTLSLSFNNDGPLGTYFRYICEEGTYLARYDDLYDGYDKQVDLSGVAVSTNGIELIDREFISAIQQNREPNASVSQCLDAMRTLDMIEKSMD